MIRPQRQAVQAVPAAVVQPRADPQPAAMAVQMEATVGVQAVPVTVCPRPSTMSDTQAVAAGDLILRLAVQAAMEAAAEARDRVRPAQQAPQEQAAAQAV
jgi:hypothetical protein